MDYNEIRGNKIKEMLVYLTSQCELACSHCFLKKEKPIKQLSLDDLDWLTKTFEIKSVNLLGGEPTRYPYLKEAIAMFDKVTISTNGLTISEDSSKSKELIDVFKSKGKNISIQLSIHGNQSDTDAVRGPGVWQRVLAAADILKKNGIACYFLSCYNSENLSHIPWIIDQISHPLNMPLTLFPEIGKPPLTADEQKWLFATIVKKNNEYKERNLVAQPHFFQWLGMPGRCSAGSERLCLTYNKDIVPCHFDLNYVLGFVGSKLEVINRNRESFLKSSKRISPSCDFCSKSDVCRSGCYMSEAYSGCPLKRNFTLERYAIATHIDSTALSNQISSMRKLLKGSLICP